MKSKFFLHILIMFSFMTALQAKGQKVDKLSVKGGVIVGVPIHHSNLKFIQEPHPYITEAPAYDITFDYKNTLGFQLGLNYSPFNLNVYQDKLHLNLITGLYAFGHATRYSYQGVLLDSEKVLSGEYRHFSLIPTAHVGIRWSLQCKNTRFDLSVSIHDTGERLITGVHHSRWGIYYEKETHHMELPEEYFDDSNHFKGPDRWSLPTLNLELNMHLSNQLGVFIGYQVIGVMNGSTVKNYNFTEFSPHFGYSFLSNYNFIMLGLTYNLLHHEN